MQRKHIEIFILLFCYHKSCFELLFFIFRKCKSYNVKVDALFNFFLVIDVRLDYGSILFSRTQYRSIFKDNRFGIK